MTTLGQVVQMTLKQGASGPQVAALQDQLNTLGFGTFLMPEGVDGKFGPHTAAAVEAFQKTKGLTVDGVVGPNTWAALAKASASKAVADTRPPVAPVSDSTKLWIGLIAAGLGVWFLSRGRRKVAFGDYEDDTGLEPVTDDGDEGDDDVDVEAPAPPPVQKGADVRIFP